MIGTTHYFSVEDSYAGMYRVTVRTASGALVLASTRLSNIRLAQEAVRALCTALTQDWNYRIVNQRNTGPCFTVQLQRPSMLFVSRVFSSCDAMEAEIAHVKDRARSLTTPWLHPDDIVRSGKARTHGDVSRAFAARLRTLA